MNGSTLKLAPHHTDHYLGDLKAKIVLVEYGDFECPHCANAAPILQEIINEFGSDLCFVYRHFPNLKLHPNAGVAAVTSEAAALQDKFWEMHQALYSHFNDLAGDKMLYLARELDLDMRKFLNDLEDEKLSERVHLDFLSGKNNNLTSTPALFLNGIHLHAMPSYHELKVTIKNAFQIRR